MAEQELVIELVDLNRFQILCGNPECPAPVVPYEMATLDETFEKKCPACGAGYPEPLIAAVEHYLHFFESATDASKSNSTKISLKVRL
jgi:hypothetical protein